jgi:transposase-like protein
MHIVGPKVVQQSIIEAWCKARVLATLPRTSHVGRCDTCNIPMHRFGYTRNGTQRWRCGSCLVTGTGAYGTNGFIRASRMISPQQVEAIKSALLTPGMTLRQIEAITHHNKATIATYAKLLGLKRPPCPCGQPAGHKGWCSWQFQRHPLRQAALAKTWRVTVPSWMRPAIWVLGSDSMHSRDVHTAHCHWKGCPFPAVENTTRCRQHGNFYEYPMTMHDTAINYEEVWSPKQPERKTPLFIGHRPASTDRLEQSLRYMNRGYLDERHRNAGDAILNSQSSPSMRHMGHGKGRGSSKTSAGRRRTIARSAHNSNHRQSHDPIKRWSREALELEANRILGEEPLELDFVPLEEREDGEIYLLTSGQ